MKTLTAIIFFLVLSSGVYAQADRVFQTDSIKSSDKTALFTVNSRHNYNTFLLRKLISSDSVKVYAINEYGDTTNVALRSLETYSDLSTNLITGYTGNQEFLVMNPNIYKLLIVYSNSAPSKTITIRRRGNNLK